MITNDLKLLRNVLMLNNLKNNLLLPSEIKKAKIDNKTTNVISYNHDHLKFHYHCSINK